MELDRQPDPAPFPRADRDRARRASEANPQGHQADRRPARQTGRPVLPARPALSDEAPQPIEADRPYRRRSRGSPGSRPPATILKGTAGSPSRRSAASTTSSGSGSRGGTKGAKRSSSRSAGRPGPDHQYDVIRNSSSSRRNRTRHRHRRSQRHTRTDNGSGGDACNRLSGWSFHQLGVPPYKAKTRDPHRPGGPSQYQTPAPSAVIARRPTGKTRPSSCLHCGFFANADWNAARNIRARPKVGRPQDWRY